MQILLRKTQTEPGRTVKLEQEQISRNHVQKSNLVSVSLALQTRISALPFMEQKLDAWQSIESLTNELMSRSRLSFPWREEARFAHSIHTEPKKVFVRCLVNFVPAVAYLFCLNLPAAFSQPRTKTFLVASEATQLYGS